MFAQHQPIISQWALSRPENFARVGLLCLLSARVHFQDLRPAMERTLRGQQQDLWSWKGAAWAEMQDLAETRWDTLRVQRQIGAGPVRMLQTVVSWTGFGFVKGGFFLQLTTGTVGCLDVRNQAEFNTGRIRDPDWRRPRAVARHASQYVAWCNILGGAEFLWDNWCAGLAADRTTPFETAWDVSAEHCRILGLDPGRRP